MKLLDDTNFKDTTANGIHLIDLYADWCGPCRALSPLLEELDSKFEDVSFAKVDVDASPDIQSEFEVMSIPTVLIIKDGKEVKRLIGLQPKSAYIDAIEEAKSNS